MMNPTLRLVIGSFLLFLAACGPNRPPTATPATSLDLPAGLRAEVVATGLRSPTAMAAGPDGALYITQLSGGENDGQGQVVRIARADSTPQIVLEGLRKPTGLAWRGDTLFIVAFRDLLMTKLVDQRLAPPTPVLKDLPYNGRSLGQATALPDGSLLIGVSGNIGQPGGSILVLSLDNQPTTLATGLKNPYDQAFDSASGTLYVTEISEELIDGQPPLEELNLLLDGSDYGWPRCDAQGLPITSRGGNVAECATTVIPLATFPARATPSGLAFQDGAGFPADYGAGLYVALWNSSPPAVWRLARAADGALAQPTPFIGGLVQPIDLLADPLGGLLVLDFGAGAIYRIIEA